MPKNDPALLEACKQLAPGFYTERDGGYWYVVTPDHSDRVGEEFRNQDDARRFLLWLAGEPMPAGWRLERSGDGRIAYDLHIPGTVVRATVWARTCRKLFPMRAADLAQVAP